MNKILQRAEETKWEICAYCFLLALFAWRIFYLYIAPIELSPDEAYYWEWSRRLDWGYYSKPPMVAWIMALSTKLFGNTAFAVRLPAAVLGTLSIVFSYLAAKSIFSPRAGMITAALAAASPGASVAGFIMTIDAPLLCFWSMALYFAWKAVETNEKPEMLRTLWWITAGIFAGAGFLTKQTMFAFWPMFFLFLAAGKDTRKLLKSWGLYISVSISALMLLPVIWWNIQHDWITLSHTAHHFQQNDRSLTESLSTFLEFAGSQLAVISPVTCLLLYASGISGLLHYRTFILRNTQTGADSPDPPSDSVRIKAGGMLLLTGIAVLIPITFLSFKQRVNANWPAPFYISLFIFAAGWLTGAFKLHRNIERMKKLQKPALMTGALMAVLVYLLPVLVPALGLEATALDPLVRVKGWKALAANVDSIKNTLPHPEKTFIITRRRQTASTLAFYMKNNPMPYRWKSNRRNITTQYEIWPGPYDKIGWDALILIDAEKKLPSDLPAHFEEVKPLEPISIRLGGREVRRFNVFWGKKFQMDSMDMDAIP